MAIILSCGHCLSICLPCFPIAVFHNYYDTNLSHNTKLESFFKWIGGNKIQHWVAVGIDANFKNKMA